MQTLSDLMEFDHVIRVSGTVITDDDCPYPPDCFTHYDATTQTWAEPELDSGEWSLLTGFTGQYGYKGAAMHQSEFIGDALETHIRENPGYYVALVAYPACDCPDDDVCSEFGHDEPENWVVAFREL